MSDSNRSQQNIAINNSSIPGQIGIAGENLTQIQVEGSDNVITIISPNEIKQREFNLASPYKGLKKFEQKDAEYFFGRDQFCKGLIDELEQTNFVLLLGASGSGKSSLVGAGLIPHLQKKWTNKFINLILKPDRNPFESLYSSLISCGYSQDEVQLARDGQEDTFGQIISTLKPSDEFWLIFIDQLEELFTLSSVEKRNSFIRSLVKLSKKFANDPTLKIVATMRSDFLDQLDPEPANQLARLTDKHRPLITQMQPDELRQAIEQPAAQHGVVFEEKLVKEIIKDVEGEPGYLPLLQYTLDLLWEVEVKDDGIKQDRTLGSETYRYLGGVRGALQQRVDQIYQNFSSSEQLTAKQIFLRLVEIGGNEAAGADWRPVRRRAKRSEFSSDQEQQVLSRLINANLLVSDAAFESIEQPQSTSAATVEIAHEALLSSWKTLQGWIDESKEVIIINNRLRDDASRWRELLSANPAVAVEELWSGTKLERVLELQKQRLFEITLGGLTKEERAFVQNSVKRQQRVRQEAEAVKQRELKMTQEALEQEKRATAAAKKAEVEERRARKATQRVAGIGAALLLTVVGGVGGIWWQWKQSQLNQLLADVVSGVTSPELLPAAEQAFNQGEKLRKSARIEDAFTKYKIARNYALNLQQASNNNRTANFDSAALEKLSDDAEKAMIDLIRETRLPELKSYLENKKIGDLDDENDYKNLQDRYELGALRTTYVMVMRDTGADADNSGTLESGEATRIPCAVLKDIETAWRNLTNNQCGWTRSEDSWNLDAPVCDQLGGQSLTYWVFEISPEVALNRMLACKIIRPNQT
jgi:energy-coupling factor transporter ATP-binding protein EcfA2